MTTPHFRRATAKEFTKNSRKIPKSIELPYPLHPICEAFPAAMSGQEWEDFVADIEANGVKRPIILHEGQVIDGRRRMVAAAMTKQLLLYEEWNGQGSMADFVTSLNVHRRHETPESLDLIAARLMPFYEDEARARMEAGTLASVDARGKASAKAAAAVGASQAGTERAARVIRRGVPELVEALQQGRLSTSRAAEIATMDPAAQVKAINQEGRGARQRAKRDSYAEDLAGCKNALKKALKRAVRLGDVAERVIEAVETAIREAELL
jgi:hypothetical protein